MKKSLCIAKDLYVSFNNNFQTEKEV